MVKKKEEAMQNYISMIQNSWTYARLTEKEQKQLLEVFNRLENLNRLKGSYNQRVEFLNEVYYAFLVALGYQPMGWRGKEDVPQF